MILIKMPLHIKYINETMVYLEKMVLSNPKLRPIFNELMKKESVKGFKPMDEAESNLMSGLNLLFSVKNAQEVVVKNGEIPSRTGDWDLKNIFNPPFEDMVINMHFKDGYLPIFLQLFKLDENYIDTVKGEVSPVYIAKTMVLTDGKSALNYRAAHEVILIKSKLPRMIFPSYISHTCRECTQVTETDIMGKIYGNVHPGVRYCLKTPSTAGNCKKATEQSLTFAQSAMKNVRLITDVIERLNAPVDHVMKTSVEHKQRTSEETQSRYVSSDRSYIEIKKEIIDRPTVQSIPKGGTHASPCTHPRVGHWRNYKSGKSTWIDKQIINPEGKKAVYVIKGGGKEK